MRLGLSDLVTALMLYIAIKTVTKLPYIYILTTTQAKFVPRQQKNMLKTSFCLVSYFGKPQL